MLAPVAASATAGAAGPLGHGGSSRHGPSLGQGKSGLGPAVRGSPPGAGWPRGAPQSVGLSAAIVRTYSPAVPSTGPRTSGACWRQRRQSPTLGQNAAGCWPTRTSSTVPGKLSRWLNRCGRAEQWRLASRGTSPTEEAMSETSFSTTQPPSREDPRVPSPNGDEGRSGSAKSAPPEGPSPPGSLTWRTRGRAAFEGLRHAGTVRSGPFTVSWLPGTSDQPPALAFAINKRVGNAVVRNRLRRRLREAARHLATLPPGAYLIRARPSAVALSFQEISTHLAGAVSSLTSPGRLVPRQAPTRQPVTSEADLPVPERL